MSEIGENLKRNLQEAAQREKQQRMIIAATIIIIFIGVIIWLTN